MAHEDIIFLHAPSVYDFRKKPILYGPVSDVVPSSPIFEMYPLGFMTMSAHLERAGYRTRIMNLAVRMLYSNRFDVERTIARLDAEVFGIDLHWLPHAHGAIEVARMVKRLHPESKVVFGGFSSTYFHRELLGYDCVDMVMKGDSTEPLMVDLMDRLSSGGDVVDVQNLSWKDSDGRHHHNPITFVPDSMDYMDIDYGQMIRSTIRHLDIRSALPWKGWDRLPLGSVFSVKGCTLNCTECGGSCSAGRNFLGRQRAAFRTPEMLAEDVYVFSQYLKSPVFVIGDIRQAGDQYAERFLRHYRELGCDNHLAFEIFKPAGDELFELMDHCLGEWSLEFSPESHDPEVRRMTGKRFDNRSIVSTVERAMAHQCQRLDMFFMTGLPGQTRDSALDTARFVDQLYDACDDDLRMFPFIAPFAPFVDPGSRAFEDPDRWGYRFFARTLEEHRRLLDSPSWKNVLSYETRWMSREEIADTSYDAALILNQVLLDRGQVTRDEFEGRSRRTEVAKKMVHDIDDILARFEGEERERALFALKDEAQAIMTSTICEKRDLDWMTSGIWANGPRVMRGILTSKRVRRRLDR